MNLINKDNSSFIQTYIPIKFNTEYCLVKSIKDRKERVKKF